MLRRYLPLAALFLAQPNPLSAAAPPSAPPLRAAVARALPLIQRGSAGHMTRRDCFACHHLTIPVLALTTARSRGLAIDEEVLGKQRRFLADVLEQNRDRYHTWVKGRAHALGALLWTAEMGGARPDRNTAAAADYLLVFDKDKDHWKATGSRRPPSMGSRFTATYLAVRGLQAFGTPAQKKQIAQRLRTVRGWLEKTPAHDTEDRVFRLWALQRVGADPRLVQTTARELLRTQRPDGGWAQLEGMKSDAYATGTALVVLHQAAGLATSDPAYRRGVKYLLGAQLANGTWHVRTRSEPVQFYFETGFPHGKDQFISLAATSWATTALALALPPVERSVGPRATARASGR
jgi:hypothetical protein